MRTITKFSSSNGVKVNNDTSSTANVTMKMMTSESSATINNNNTINNNSQQQSSSQNSSSCNNNNNNNNNISSSKLLLIADDSRHFSQVTCTTLNTSKSSTKISPEEPPRMKRPSSPFAKCKLCHSNCCKNNCSSISSTFNLTPKCDLQKGNHVNDCLTQKVSTESTTTATTTSSDCAVMKLSNVPSNTSLCNCNDSNSTVDIVKIAPGTTSPAAAATTTTIKTTTIVDRIIEEIIETEKSYSRDLRDIINGYLYFVTRNKIQQSANCNENSCTSCLNSNLLTDQVNYSIENMSHVSSSSPPATNELTSAHLIHSCQQNRNLCHKQRDIKYLCELNSFNNHSSLTSPNVINGNTECNLTSPYASEKQIPYVNCGQMCTNCTNNNSSSKLTTTTIDKSVNCISHNKCVNKQIDGKQMKQFTNCPIDCTTNKDDTVTESQINFNNNNNNNNNNSNNCSRVTCCTHPHPHHHHHLDCIEEAKSQNKIESIAKSSSYSPQIALDNKTMNECDINGKEELPQSQGKLSLDTQEQFTADTCDVNINGATKVNTNVSICSCCLSCVSKSSTNYNAPPATATTQTIETTQTNISSVNHGEHLVQLLLRQPRPHEQLVNAYDSTCPNSTICTCQSVVVSIDNLTRTCHQSLCPSMSSRHETCQLVSHNNNQKQVHQSNLNTGNIDTESLPSTAASTCGPVIKTHSSSPSMSMSNCINCCKCHSTNSAKNSGQPVFNINNNDDIGNISPEQMNLLDKVTPEEVAKVVSLFGNLEQIAQFSQLLVSQFNEALANGQGNSLLTASLIASIFIENASQFQVYTEYCAIDYPRSHTLLDELMANDTMKQLFQKQQIKLNHSLPLATYLLKPVQRVLKYPLLLQTLLKNVQKQFDDGNIDESQVVTQLKSALNSMTEYACKMNEAKRTHEELNQNLYFNNNNNCFNRLRRNSSSSNSSSRSRKSSTLRRSISSFSSSSSTTSSSSVTVSNIVTAIRDLVIAVKESSKKRKRGAIKLYKKIITIAKKDSNSSAIYTFK